MRRIIAADSQTNPGFRSKKVCSIPESVSERRECTNGSCAACSFGLETGLGTKGIVTEAELLEATGYTARGRLIGHLDRCGIRFFAGNGGQIWTTLDAINAALKPEAERPREVAF
jgi:hypothetical protein